MRVVGPGEALWGWGTGSTVHSSLQGEVPSQLWEAPSSSRARCPGMLCLDVAAPPASRPVPSCPVPSCPVWAALSSLPAQARGLQADTRCLQEQRLRVPPRTCPLPRPHGGTWGLARWLCQGLGLTALVGGFSMGRNPGSTVMPLLLLKP